MNFLFMKDIDYCNYCERKVNKIASLISIFAR